MTILRTDTAGNTVAADFPELLTADQVADLLGVSAATVSRWGALRDHGENAGPPCYTLSDRVRRWDASEVRAWLRQVRR
ncbi:MAG: helix-turn-helix domain-containing protein [Actinomycetia bacterium]|nr:helix-turn-helix domain-containing protein [Actinomycetes bacterium]